MPVIVRTPNEILTDVYNRLVRNTQAKNPSPGSTVRMISEIFSEDLGRAYADVSFNVAQTFVSKAIGENLDLIGNVLGVVRSQATTAIDTTRTNFRFEIDPATGLLASDLAVKINDWLTRNGRTSVNVGANNFTILAGTRINSDSDVQYVTLDDAVFNPTDSEVYVGVMALVPGSVGRVGAGALRTHDIVSVQEEFTPVASIILCQNLNPITSSSDREGDDAYRFRIINQSTAKEGANETSIRIAALAVPGVGDIRISDLSHGVGTFTVFVIGNEPLVSDGILNAVKAIVTERSAKGIRVSVSRPVLRSVELDVTPDFEPAAGETQRITIKENIRRTVVEYINNVEMGGSLVINRLIQTILQVDPLVRDVSVSNMVIGEYNIVSRAIIRRVPVFTVNQTLYWDEKFFCTPSMLRVC